MLSFKLMTLMTMISFYVYTGVIAKGYAGGKKRQQSAAGQQ